MNARARLRSELRARRRTLSPETRFAAAAAIARHLSVGVLATRMLHIAAYVAVNGEADPGPFIAAARDRGRQIYLPVLDRVAAPTLRFVRTEAGQALPPNRFGIPEPEAGTRVAATCLDLVLVPLVAVDDRGNRLGMGAGYYDRAFAFLARRRRWRKPRLVGVAYDFQRLRQLDAEGWDVPLDGVVTECGMRWFRRD